MHQHKSLRPVSGLLKPEERGIKINFGQVKDCKGDFSKRKMTLSMIL
jgi:hypothetical protein